MDQTTIGIIGLAVFFLLLVIRMPVAFAMLVVGIGGTAWVSGSWAPALNGLALETFEFASTQSLIIIPLFVLMGNLASVSGMSRDLYAAAYEWVGHWRGGLASATVVGCAGFAALSGSSVASAVTMGRVALPEMKRYKYSDRLATGAIAAGGTLGILIPPSTGFIIYAILTETSIGKLFLAGVLPGLLLAGLFVLAILIQTLVKPELGPARPRERSGEAYWSDWRRLALVIQVGLFGAIALLLAVFGSPPWAFLAAVAGASIALLLISSRARFFALLKALPIVLIILITIGGIYGGAFTPVEASGVGAMLALVFALAIAARALKEQFSSVLLQSVRTTAMSMLIIISAHVFSPFLARTEIPSDLAIALGGMDLGPGGILLIVLFAFIVMGTFLEGFAMLVLAVPIVLPIIAVGGVPEFLGIETEFGADTVVQELPENLKIWFGVIMVIVLEMGLISPPVGVNVFVVKGIAEDVPMGQIFIGILPFWFAMAICLVLLILFPEIALFLPDTMIQAG